MNNHLRIVVHGQPAPQGSKRARAAVKDGAVKTWTVEQNKVPVDQWRSDVKDAAIKATTFDQAPFAAAVTVTMVFSFRRPESHYGTGRNARTLKPSAPARPVTKAGDLDKLARSTCDALTASGIWRDDKLVAEFTRLAKVWCGEDPDALDTPGALITISQI